ncbi:MAG: hypothetical protein JXA09_05700 [Anaerolineae bacterium]|nr:hypothetical protein [Anaerolineae bacterium]
MSPDTDRKERENGPEAGTRWSAVLQQVHEASQSDAPWYQKVGVFLAWAVGIALAVGIATLLVLAVVDLFSPERMLNPMTISNWLFYAAVIILFAGLLAPSASDLEASAQERRRKAQSQSSATRRATAAQLEADDKESVLDRLDRRRQNALRRRMERVYNPWLGRLSASALFCFGLAMLAWVLA